MKARINSAHVLALIAIVLALGGNAIALTLGKNSVGTKQLKKNSVTKAKIKKNAVTAAKIKKNAVTKAKIKNGAVNGAKIADGSVGGTEIDAASTPFSRIVYEARGNATVALPKEKFTPYLLDNGTYTQEPGRDDTYLGAVDVTFKPTCNPPRNAAAYALVDAANPAEPSEADVVAAGLVQDQGSGEVGKRINLGPYLGARFQSDTATTHTIALVVQVDCNSGEGATATSGAVDVIGTK